MDIRGQFYVLTPKGKDHYYPLNLTMGWPLSGSGYFVHEKNLLLQLGTEPQFLGHLACSSVTTLDYAIMASFIQLI